MSAVRTYGSDHNAVHGHSRRAPPIEVNGSCNSAASLAYIQYRLRGYKLLSIIYLYSANYICSQKQYAAPTILGGTGRGCILQTKTLSERRAAYTSAYQLVPLRVKRRRRQPCRHVDASPAGFVIPTVFRHAPRIATPIVRRRACSGPITVSITYIL
jgi:hypothetical protein